MRVKLEVVQKKMSVIGEDGRVKLSMREATILACIARQPKIPGSDNRAAMSGNSKLGTTNQNTVKTLIMEEQITHQEDRTENRQEGR